MCKLKTNTPQCVSSLLKYTHFHGPWGLIMATNREKKIKINPRQTGQGSIPLHLSKETIKGPAIFGIIMCFEHVIPQIIKITLKVKYFFGTSAIANDRISNLTHKKRRFCEVLTVKYKVGTKTRHGWIQKLKWGFEFDVSVCFPFNISAFYPSVLALSLGKLLPGEAPSTLDSQDPRDS